MRRLSGDVLQELLEPIHLLLQPFKESAASLLPRGQRQVDDACDHQREPATVRNLGHVGTEQAELDQQEEQRDGPGQHAAQAPGPRATRYVSIVVMTIVAPTAMPYAEARPLDVWKPSTRPIVQTISAQFTCGI